MEVNGLYRDDDLGLLDVMNPVPVSVRGITRHEGPKVLEAFIFTIEMLKWHENENTLT